MTDIATIDAIQTLGHQMAWSTLSICMCIALGALSISLAIRSLRK